MYRSYPAIGPIPSSLSRLCAVARLCSLRLSPLRSLVSN